MQLKVDILLRENISKMSIGERIADLRKGLNLSQGQLADALEISRQAVSKWENDQACPDTLNLIRMADLLNTDVEYLATGRISVPQKEYVTVKVPEIQEKIVEKVVEKPVIRTVEKLVEKPVIKRMVRVKYLRNPFEFALLGILCFLFGLIIGRLL